MSGSPLLPKECHSCGRKNNCLADSCIECGARLEDNQLPARFPEESQEEDELRQELEEMQKRIENELEDLQ